MTAGVSAVVDVAAGGVLAAGDAVAAGEGRVGGKAIGLARLAGAGASVPWWVVLPVGAFERHLASAGLEGLVRDELSGLTRDRVAAASERLQGAVVEAPLEPALAASCGASDPRARVGGRAQLGGGGGLGDALVRGSVRLLSRARGRRSGVGGDRALLGLRLQRAGAELPPGP